MQKYTALMGKIAVLYQYLDQLFDEFFASTARSWRRSVGGGQAAYFDWFREQLILTPANYHAIARRVKTEQAKGAGGGCVKQVFLKKYSS